MRTTPSSLVQPCLFLALCAALLGCDPEPESGVGGEPPEAAQEEDFRRFYATVYTSGGLGYRMNTNHAGGHFFSELDLGGAEHEGTRLLNIVYDEPCWWGTCSTPVLPSSIEVLDGVLVAQLEDGRSIFHTDFGQTRWAVETQEHGGGFARHYELTIEAGSDAATGIPTYTFYWDAGQGEGPESTCLVSGEIPQTTAVVYADLDIDDTSGAMSVAPGLLMIACTAGAVGKAALWGYGLDTLNAAHGSDGLPIFEASVRMIRADYCGDGQSWTFPGTAVIVEDTLGINGVSSGLWWPGQPIPTDEAVWNRHGAVCLDTARASASGPVVVSCQNGVIVWPCFWGTAAALSDPAALFRTSTP